MSQSQPRSIAQIESDLEATRERLGSTINELQAVLAPSAVVDRGTRKVKNFFVDEEDGSVKVKNIALIVGGVVAVGVGARMAKGAMHAVFGRPRQPEYVYVPVPRSAVGALGSAPVGV